MCYIGGMNANAPIVDKAQAMQGLLQITVNGKPLPLFHALTVHVALQELGSKMSKRNAMGRDGEEMRVKYLTAVQQINSLYIKG